MIREVEVDNAVEVDYDADEFEFTVISASRERDGASKGSWVIHSVVVIEALAIASQVRQFGGKSSDMRSRSTAARHRQSPIKDRRYSALDRYRSLSRDPTGYVAPAVRESSVSVRRRSLDETLLPNYEARKSVFGKGFERQGVKRRGESMMNNRMSRIDEESKLGEDALTTKARNRMSNKRAASLSLRRKRSEEETVLRESSTAGKGLNYRTNNKRAASLSIRRTKCTDENVSGSRGTSLSSRGRRSRDLSLRRGRGSSKQMRHLESSEIPTQSDRRKLSFRIFPLREDE